MSKILNLIKRIKGMLNRNPKLEEGHNQIEEMPKTDNSKRDNFRQSLGKIYTKENSMNEIMSQLGINQELIKNKFAYRRIVDQIEEILEERKINWPQNKTAINSEDMTKIIQEIKNSGKEREEDRYASYYGRKIDGFRQSGLKVDEKGNVIFTKISIKAKDERALGDDEYMQSTISLNEDGTVHNEGYYIKLDSTTSHLREEKDATRDFVIDYYENGEKKMIQTHTYSHKDGEKSILTETHEEGEQLLTLQDHDKLSEIMEDINQNGQEGIDRTLQKWDTFKAGIKQSLMPILLKHDFSYISYDQSNDSKLYVKCLEQLEIQIQKEMFHNKGSAMSYFETILRPVLNEIKNPKKVELGKYKIPQKYLFEAIRNGADFYKEAIKEEARIDKAYRGKDRKDRMGDITTIY